MVNLDRVKLTEVEQKLEIAVEALRQISVPSIANYHNLVDQYNEIAQKALEKIEDVE